MIKGHWGRYQKVEGSKRKKSRRGLTLSIDCSLKKFKVVGCWFMIVVWTMSIHYDMLLDMFKTMSIHYESWMELKWNNQLLANESRYSKEEVLILWLKSTWRLMNTKRRELLMKSEEGLHHCLEWICIGEKFDYTKALRKYLTRY